MARQRMVTRTVIETVAEVMYVDITTAQVGISTFTVAGEYTNDDVLSQVKKAHESDTIKMVSVQSYSHKETLYGMPEAQFIELAKVLPPRAGQQSN